MGYRFLDDYDPQKEQKKRQQNGALSAPRSGNSKNTGTPTVKKTTAAPAATPRTTMGTALGGSAATPVQLPAVQVPKLTKTTPVQTTKQTTQPLKLPEIRAFGAGDYSKAGKAMERGAKTVAAGALGAASSAVEMAGQFTPTSGQQSMGQFSGFGDLGRAVQENRRTGADIGANIRQQEAQRREKQLKSQQQIFSAATRLAEKGQQYEAEAKEGLGTVGQFLVDMGVTGTQMAGDALMNLVLPGSGLAMMGLRSYGQAAGEARRAGKTSGQQFLAGLKSAGIEMFTEKMFGAFSKVYGKAGADELVEKLVGKLTKNTTGQALLTWMVNAAGEGVEEVTSDLLNPLADRLLGLDNGKGAIYSMDDLAQWGYDFLLGTAMGVLGGGTQLAQGVRQGQAQTAEADYYADLKRSGLGSTGHAANAQKAGNALGRLLPGNDGVAIQRLQMPTLTTYEQRAAEYRGEKPQNVSDPRIGRLEISSEKYNPEGADISTIYGNRYRQQVKEDAIRRLGIADGKPAYLVASNITKNGREYYVDVTKASLNKMLYTRDHEMLPLERILLVENLEKAIDNSYWAESNGDRKSRPQIDGFDTLRTSFYIDGIPYYADIKVKVIQGKNSTDPQNVVYFLEPEEITAIKKVDAPSPTGALLERNIVFRDGTSTVDTTVPQKESGVNAQDTQDNGNYAERPAAPLRMPHLTTYEQREKTTTEAQKVSRMNNENGLAAYTQQERINLSSGIKNKIISTYQETVNFVKNALVNKNNADRAYMGIVPENVANQVKKETGVDISGYGVMMNGVDIRHIIKEHGNPVTEPERGQVAVTAEDIARVPEVIAHPDEVYLSDKTDAKGRKAIVFEKQFGDTYITIQGVSNGKKLLQTNTLYKRKGKARTTRYTMIDAQESAAPVINVQNGPPQSLSYETSVPQEKETVNRLKMPQLVDEQGRTYEQRMAAEQKQQAARDAQEDAEAISRATAMMDRDFAEAAERANEQRTQQEAQGKEMPEALKKLGVAPFGSEADYAGIGNLAGEIHGNMSARRKMQEQISKIPATEKERTFARQLAEGTLDWEDVPNTVDRETVDKLVGYYQTLNDAPETMLLRQRRAAILDREMEKMEPLLGMEVAYDEGGMRGNGKSSGKIARKTSTLRRNLQTPGRICTTEWGPEHGKKVYDTLFYPVTENNGRQIDWVNSMLDKVRTFTDSKGNDRELNRKERELVQKIVEYRASEKRVAVFDKQYKGAVENVRKGWTARDAAQEFGIDESYQEFQDLKNYETYLQALDELHKSKSADNMAVGKAVAAYRELYQDMYEGINAFLVAHGYQPIGFIEGYAPHLQPEAEKTAFSKALKLLGIDDMAMSLPTSISGKTADLKPYKQYNPFFQERKGVNTEYDIAKGFEDYVYYLGNIFYHTDDIMRIRTAEKYIRKTYSSEEASEQISWAENARNFNDAQIADFLKVNGIIQPGTKLADGDARMFLNDYIDKLYDQIGNVSRYSEMAKYLDNYANRLAGKQNTVDRGAEAAAGRGSLNWLNNLSSKYGGAKLAFNFSSALNQTAQLPMVLAENGEITTVKAMRDFFTKEKANFVKESNFLKGKKGIEWLLGPETGWEKFKELGFTMTEAVDSFTAYVAVRSKYLKEVRNGKSHEDAMKLADEYGRNVMGSRARGEKPVLFDTKNPFWQIATRFQLEAMNSWEHITRDLPNEVRQMAQEQGKAKAARTMGVRAAKYMAYAFLANLGIGALSGGSPVPYDLLGTAMEALGEAMGLTKWGAVKTVLDNVLQGMLDQRLLGTDEPDDDEDKDWWAFLKSIFGDVADDIPILGRAAALAGIGDQTLPVADLSKVGDLAKSVKNNGIASADTLDKALTAGGEFLFGGNQLRKTLQGGIAAAKGGVYSNGKLRYQVEQTPGNIAKGLLFGRSALNETQEYYADRTSDFTENQTEAFKQMQDAGVSAKDSYDLIQQLRSIEKTEDATKAELQRKALRKSDISGQGKFVVYYQTMASDKEVKALDAMPMDTDLGTVTYLLMDMKECDTDAEKLALIAKSKLTEEQKAALYKNTVAGDEDLEKMESLARADISDIQYFQYKVASSGMTKKAEKMQAINSLDLTSAQKDAIYYAEGWAQSTIGQAPWRSGYGGYSDGYSGGSSGKTRGSYLQVLAAKNGIDLYGTTGRGTERRSYLQYLAEKNGKPLTEYESGSTLRSSYLRMLEAKWKNSK